MGCALSAIRCADGGGGGLPKSCGKRMFLFPSAAICAARNSIYCKTQGKRWRRDGSVLFFCRKASFSTMPDRAAASGHGDLSPVKLPDTGHAVPHAFSVRREYVVPTFRQEAACPGETPLPRHGSVPPQFFMQGVCTGGKGAFLREKRFREKGQKKSLLSEFSLAGKQEGL